MSSNPFARNSEIWISAKAIVESCIYFCHRYHSCVLVQRARYLWILILSRVKSDLASKNVWKISRIISRQLFRSISARQRAEFSSFPDRESEIRFRLALIGKSWLVLSIFPRRLVQAAILSIDFNLPDGIIPKDYRFFFFSIRERGSLSICVTTKAVIYSYGLTCGASVIRENWWLRNS